MGAVADGAESVNIDDADEVYRRLAPDWITNGEVNSAAFKERGKPRSSTPVRLRVSVDLAKFTTPQESLGRAAKGGIGLGVLVSQIPRGLELTVDYDPQPDNPAHAEIRGEFDREKCRKLAEATAILIQPAAP